MERTSSLSCPSFWKLLMDEDFNRGIRIPHSFSSELEGRNSPSNYWCLITEDKKRSSNHPWRAKLVKKDHYFYLCRKSWPEFVGYHKFKHGDLLLFHLTENNTFSVTPYGANGSKKKLDDHEDSDDSSDDSDDDSGDDDDDSDVVRTPKFHRQDSKHKRKERGDRESPMSKKARNSSDHDRNDYYTDESEWESGEDGANERGDRSYRKPRAAGRPVLYVDAKSRKEIAETTSSKEASKWDNHIDLAVDNNEKPYFIRTIKDQNKNNVVVPKGFAVGMNLLEPCDIMLCCEDGDHKRSWKAKIFQTKNGRIFIRDGWGEFRREYGIQVGETCRFTMAKHHDVATFSVHVFGCHSRFRN